MWREWEGIGRVVIKILLNQEKYGLATIFCLQNTAVIGCDFIHNIIEITIDQSALITDMTRSFQAGFIF